MTIKELYKYTRADGGVTTSLIKPEGAYNVLYRIIADEGKEVSHDEVNWSVCVDSDTNKGWKEREAQQEEARHDFRRN